MPDTPILDESQPVDDEEQRRRAIPVDTPDEGDTGDFTGGTDKAIPMESSAMKRGEGTAIPMRPEAGSTEDLESRVGQHVRPIPTEQAPGSTEDLERRSLASFEHPHSAPIQTGVASLWGKAQNIHNPILRVLGEIGAGGARVLDAAGTVFAPGIASVVPGSTVNESLKRRSEAKQETNQAALDKEKAETDEARARADAIKSPQPKEGLTPEETTIHDLMTGEGGQPRVNPETQQPYTYLDAYKAVKSATGAKPETEGKTITTAQGVMQWNPETKRYDIPAGESAKPDKTDQPQQQLIDAEAAVQNAKTPEEKTAAQAKVTQLRQSIADYASASQKPERPGAEGDKNTARADKSYQLQSTRLDKLRQPVEQINQRIGRLNDTMSQKSPQADALVAPELLTIMAGGQGSGLRMNESEIARIVGGRSAWENLKASIQHWSTNPDAARSITADQDKQIRSLVGAVQQKLVKKQAILDGAEDSLLNSDDPKDHRKILAEARKQLDAIDAGGASGVEQTRPAHVPADYVFKENGPKGKGWYKP